MRIGDRLAYISALDAQPDNGLPVLTYHHILRDEENTRFRHTSTTTSAVSYTHLEHAYMAHCHLLEHEDTGMMLGFTV